VELHVYVENRESCTISELYGLNTYLYILMAGQEGPKGHRCYFDVFEAT
jgi:hypothetical protein